MKLTFLGANHEVTGSCTLLEAAGQRYLIDCGMEQGKDVYENQPIPVAPGEIDGVLATHAHIDHTGLLPLLVRNGFRGRIYATRPTAELCSIMLRDSAHIQEFEAEWKNRKGQRSGAEPVEPMYTIQDAEAAIALFRGYDYNKEIELAPGIVIRFVDVGHLLGSSSIEIWVTENGTTTKLVFSGDIGNLDPCPYRPHGPSASSGAQRLPGQDLCHQAHGRTVQHHAARLGAHPGIRSRVEEPQGPALRCRACGTHVHHSGRRGSHRAVPGL